METEWARVDGVRLRVLEMTFAAEVGHAAACWKGPSLRRTFAAEVGVTDTPLGTKNSDVSTFQSWIRCSVRVVILARLADLAGIAS